MDVDHPRTTPSGARTQLRSYVDVRAGDVSKAWRTQDVQWKSKRAMSTRPGGRKTLDGNHRGRCHQGGERKMLDARCSMKVKGGDVSKAWRTQDAQWKSKRAISIRPGERKMFDARCSMKVKEDDVNKAWKTQDAQRKSRKAMSARPGERKMLNRSQKEAMSTRPGERKMLDARCSREFKAGDVNKARQEVAACAEDHGSLNESPPPLSSAYLSSKHSLPRWPAHQHSQQAVPS